MNVNEFNNLIDVLRAHKGPYNPRRYFNYLEDPNSNPNTIESGASPIGIYCLMYSTSYLANKICLYSHAQLAEIFDISSDDVTLIFGPNGCNNAKTAKEAADFIHNFVHGRPKTKPANSYSVNIDVQLTDTDLISFAQSVIKSNPEQLKQWLTDNKRI